MNEIVAAFKAAGIPLEHFPEEKGFREMWQYDGDCGGPLVQLFAGMNGLHKMGVFGTYDNGRGGSWDLSCCMDDWMETFGKYIPLMVRGEKLPY